MLASALIFAAFALLSVMAALHLIDMAELSHTTATLWTVAFGVFIVATGGVHLDRLYYSGGSWNVTGPPNLSSESWHDFLFSRILFWITLFTFVIFLFASLGWVGLTGALLVLTSFSVPVAMIWIATALRFDASAVKQLKP